MSSSSSVQQLEIKDHYTDASFVVFGYGGGEQTQNFMHLLKTQNQNGRSNFGYFTYKTDGTNNEPIKRPGYVYSTKKDRERVGKLVGEINKGIHPPVKYVAKKEKVAADEQSKSSKGVVSGEVDLKNYVSKELFMQIVSRVQLLEQEVALLRSAALGKSSGKNEAQEEDVQDESDEEEVTVEPRRCPMWGAKRKINDKP